MECALRRPARTLLTAGLLAASSCTMSFEKVDGLGDGGSDPSGDGGASGGIGGAGGASNGTGGDGPGGVVGTGGFGTPTCGNGVVETLEQCDGSNLDGENCSSLTFGMAPFGQLFCSPSCTFMASGCTGPLGSGGVEGMGGMGGMAAFTLKAEGK